MENYLTVNQRLERLQGFRDWRKNLAIWVQMQMEIEHLQVVLEREANSPIRPWRQMLADLVPRYTANLPEAAVADLIAALSEMIQHYLDVADRLGTSSGRVAMIGDVMDFMDDELERQVSDLRAEL